MVRSRARSDRPAMPAPARQRQRRERHAVERTVGDHQQPVLGHAVEQLRQQHRSAKSRVRRLPSRVTPCRAATVGVDRLLAAGAARRMRRGGARVRVSSQACDACVADEIREHRGVRRQRCLHSPQRLRRSASCAAMPPSRRALASILRACLLDGAAQLERAGIVRVLCAAMRVSRRSCSEVSCARRASPCRHPVARRAFGRGASSSASERARTSSAVRNARHAALRVMPSPGEVRRDARFVGRITRRQESCAPLRVRRTSRGCGRRLRSPRRRPPTRPATSPERSSARDSAVLVSMRLKSRPRARVLLVRARAGRRSRRV